MDKNFEIDEGKILDFWSKNNIYQKVCEKNKGLKKFKHIDGPPFPTGEPHIGHLRNWAIKDCVLRFKRFQGFEVYARDGYDVHGLPVENKVQQKLKFKDTSDLQKFGEEKFVGECKKYVNEVIDSMTKRRIRFGLWMNREFYHTSNPEYLSLSWKFFKIANEKGFLYKDYKTVAWSPALETTLSDYEIKDEYTTLEDPSIYVKFKVEDEFNLNKYDEFLVIWTTTPWTLQSNLAIAMNPVFDYSKVLVKINGKEEVLIVATDLIEKCISIFSKQNNVEFIEILETKKGSEFEGLKYEHIYLNQTPSQQEFKKLKNKHIHSIILADYVTLDEGEDVLDKLEKKGYKHSNVENKDIVQDDKDLIKVQDGTGLVHIAPGHGFEDYEAGKKYNLPIFSPVDTKGYITEGLAQGVYFREANIPVMEDLKKRNLLLSSEIKSHRYPCCWRSKVPIVYRATEQWYIRRSKIVEEIIKENRNVNWFPSFAKENFNNLMEGSGDWAISRQRFWGIPLPIFEDEEGNFEVIGSKEELEERTGKKFNDIHRDDLKGVEIKLENGNIAKPVPYIADVWFDSGCASFASHYGESLNFEEIVKQYYPITWISEGRDQIRGWFSTLFTVGFILTGKAPYNQVLFQEFVMAKDGTKMSKSLGNGIDGVEALERWGADRTRYYLLTKAAPEGQINFDESEFSNIEGFFNTLSNLSRFMNSYLEEYDVRLNSYEYKNLDVEDLWILSRLNRTIFNYVKYIEDYKLNLAFSEVENFVVKDLSKTYLKIVKERTEGRDDNLVLIFQKIIREILIHLSCAVPFISEKIYQGSKLNFKKESLFLESLPDYDRLLEKEAKNLQIENNFEIAQDIIAAILNSREKAKIGVRWPLGQVDIISTLPLKQEMKPFEMLIKKLTNVLKINYDLKDVEINYVIKPNFVSIKQDFDDVSKVIKAINMSKYYISNDIKKGYKTGKYEGVKLDLDKHIIKDIEFNGELSSSDFKGGNVILHIHQDEILLEEGYLREIIRRIQMTRKEFNLNKSDEISLSFGGSDGYLLDLIEDSKVQISKKVQAKEIFTKVFENKKSYEIKGKKLIIGIEK